jgi:hypothetical protein
MDAVSSVTTAASSAQPGTVQGSAALMVLNKAMDIDAASAAQLIAALPDPALATSGTLGTQVNTYA